NYVNASVNVCPATDFQLTISVDPSKNGNGAGYSFGSIDVFDCHDDALERPDDGQITLQAGSDGHGGGYFLDPTPFDSEEFQGPIVTPFVGTAQAGSPAAGNADLYSLVLLEMTHALGLNRQPGDAFQLDGTGDAPTHSSYLQNTGQADTVDTPGTL